MKRSWSNTSSNSSPGFVYFNQSPADTAEFLSFSSSPAPAYKQNNSQTNFHSPNNYTGPNKYNSPKNYSSPNYHSSPHHHSSPSHHSSPNYQNGSNDHNNQNYHNISGQFSLRKKGNYRNKTPYASPNNSYNSNFNNSRGRSGKNKWNKGIHPQRKDGKPNISSYYDPTCTLDPWLALEQEQSKKKAEEALKDKLKNIDTEVDAIVVNEEVDSSESDDSSSTVTEEETT